MNLTEVLNVALPELPARTASKTYPRLHPRLIAREQLKDGVPTMVAMVSGGDTNVYFFTPEQWKLIELFDGKRSYAEIAEAYTEKTGIFSSEDTAREFADQLDEAGLFYRTALDLNSTAGQKLAEERRRRRSKISVSQMTFSTWDPDAYLSKLHEHVSFIYTKWFTALTLALFAIMALVFLGGWREIWNDTAEYYTFTHKGAADLAEFWLLFCGLGFFHESAHGLTCKHYGGGVHRMGFMLLYLSPAFFVDVTEVYVYGGKWQRIAAIIAGIWIELTFCSIASIVWWGTPPGSPVHDFAYKIMLITGVAVVLMNLNPLIKLDGYYLFGELVGVAALKESSTEYASSWVKCNLFRMPVEVPYLRPRRRWLFVAYAVLSGLYSYMILLAVIRFSYNVVSRFSPQWAFLPALLLALVIFRSRLRSSARFIKDLYLDKKQRLVGHGSGRKVVLVGAILLALFAPLWRETATGRFVLEPQQRATIRATVPGQIVEVLTEEGSTIAAGAPVLRMRNTTLEEEADQSLADLSRAQAGARQAQMNYSDLGHALSEQASELQRHESIAEQVAVLQVLSPISGVVMTPRIRNLAGSFVAEGSELAEVDDLRVFKARIFVPDFEIRKVGVGDEASLKLESRFQSILGRVASISATPQNPVEGLLHVQQYKGIAPPPFYVVTTFIQNAQGLLRAGMSGDAKIKVARRSAAWFLWENLQEFGQRKAW